jgi:antagonist of KipI
MRSSPVVLRYVPYKGRGAAAAGALAIFDATTFEVASDSDRMGIRLAPLEVTRLPTASNELLSFGVVRGAIQLPPGGHPIILGVDHQTTGGYPLLGVVARVDWHVLAQLKPGTQVQFRPVSSAEACTMFNIANAELRRELSHLSVTDLDSWA